MSNERGRQGRPATTRTNSEERPQRPNIGRRDNKLSIPAAYLKPGYTGYLAVAKPGNIEQMLEQGWEYVYANSGENVLNSEDASQMGTKYTIPAGGGQTYYALQIRTEWYDEIMTERVQDVHDIEEAMKQPVMNGLPTHGESYIPEGGGLKTTTNIVSR